MISVEICFFFLWWIEIQMALRCWLIVDDWFKALNVFI